MCWKDARELYEVTGVVCNEEGRDKPFIYLSVKEEYGLMTV